jgi:hypothetical protein
MKPLTKSNPLSIVLLLGLILLTGCNLPGSGSPTGPTTPPPQPTITFPTIAPTVAPTATAIPGRVILVTPPETSPQTAMEVQKALSELAAPAGISLVTVQALQPNEVTPDVKMVFYTSIPANLPQVVAAAPATQFAAASPVDITPVPNFSVIRLQPERRAFIAGLVTILSADDWRSVGLLPIQDPPASALEDSFRNGGQYFCGICNAYFAPAARFPLVRHTDSANFQAAVSDAAKKIVYAVYVDPEISTPEMLNSLAGQKYILVGGVTPPQEVLPRWAATVREDIVSPMRTLWPEMLAGKGGKVVSSAIVLENINPGLFSTGKKDLVEKAIQEINQGLIGPLTPPMQ